MDAVAPRVEARFALEAGDLYPLFLTLARDPGFRATRWRVPLRLGVMSLLIVAAGLLWGLWWLVAWGVFAVALGLVQANGAVWAWLLARRRSSRIMLGDRALAVGPGGLAATAAVGSTSSPWDAVLRVVEGDAWIAFVLRQTAGAFLIQPLATATLGEPERATVRAWAAAAGRAVVDVRRVAVPAAAG